MFSACDTNEEEKPPNPVGLWDLLSIDGQALPVNFNFANASWSIDSSSLDIRDNNTFVIRVEGLEPDYDGGYDNWAVSESGTWRQTDRTIFFSSDDEYETCLVGTVVIQSGGDTMRGDQEDPDCGGSDWVFERR